MLKTDYVYIMKGGRIMTGEKLKQVRSIRRWLEKAEKSYTSDQDISGELNLIMAQAEMQRLKEKDPAGQKKRVWGFRILALSAAVGIFFSVSFMRDLFEEKTVQPLPAPSVAVTAPPETMGTAPSQAAETVTEAHAAPAAEPAGEETAGSREEVVSPMPEPVPAKSIEQESRPAPAPVLSQKEIQSVVGEAGRALRGQS